MTGYLVRRLLQSVIVVILVTIIVFLLLQELPGGPARALLGPRATPYQIQQFSHQQGYDRPIVVQYWNWLDQLLHGNLGFSLQLNQSVTSLLADRLPKTLLLYGLATALALIVAIPIGVFQAVRRNKVSDYVLTGVSFVFYAAPAYFLGLVLIYVFADTVHWFPAEAPQGSFSQAVSDPQALVLPVIALSLLSIGQFTRYMRSSVLDQVVQDYVRTARAKGAGEQRILYRHVLRNALIPIATLVGIQIPVVLSGALLTESVFNYPGMGYLFWQGAQTQDYPILLGFVLVVAIAAVVGSLIADLAYAVLDPRVRFGS